MPNEKGTTVHTLQKKFQNAFGFTLPLFHGRGLLNCMCSCSWCTIAVSASASRVLRLRLRLRFSHDASLQITLASCRIAVVSSPSVSTPFIPRLRSYLYLPLPFPPAYSLTCLPVGRPIHVTQNDKPSKEEVETVQKLYIEELLRYVFVEFALVSFLSSRILFRSTPPPFVCHRRFSPSTSSSSRLTPHHHFCRIWNNYKDTFARQRTRELSIID